MPGFLYEVAAFKKPSECTLADLAGELRRNEDLAEDSWRPDPDLCEGRPRRRSKVNSTLLPRQDSLSEVATLLVNHKEVMTPEFIKTALASHAAGLAGQPSFPERSVPNKERRVGRVGERVKKAEPQDLRQTKALHSYFQTRNPGRRLASGDVHEPRGHDCMPNVLQGNALQTSTDGRVLL